MDKKTPKLNVYQQSFQDVHDRRQPKLQARRDAATAAMGDAYKTDISKYDYKSAGHGKFDMHDVKALRQAGYDDDAIAKYSTSLGADQLGEGIRHNHQKFAGQHATKGFDKSKGIESFDVGRGFNMSDVKYLQAQGYSDNEIARAANKSVLEGGKRHGNAMARFMHNQGHLNYYHGDWKNAKDKAQSHLNKGGDNNSINDSFNDNSDRRIKDSFNDNRDQSVKDSFNTKNDIRDSFNTNQTTEIQKAQEQNITQNNDLNQTMGDNNVVTNNVDNSIRQYGGDNRSMVINTSGGGRLTNQLDGAATAATLGGFYDADDSPSASASFLDRYNVMNKDMQKGFTNGSEFTARAIGMANKNTEMKANKFDKRVMARRASNESKSRLMYNSIFGDPSKKTADWQRPDTPDPVKEPDWKDMYGKFTDF